MNYYINAIKSLILLNSKIRKIKILINYFFYNRDNREVIIQNFEILEKAFTSLEIKFDSSKAIDIIQQKKGVATKLIYQIKTAIDKKGSTVNTLKYKKCKINYF